MPSLSSKIKDPENRNAVLAIGFAAVATGIVIYGVRKAFGFDLTISNPSKGEYYKDDPVDEPKPNTVDAEYAYALQGDAGVLHVRDPHI